MRAATGAMASLKTFQLCCVNFAELAASFW
jgi:hypothetical protein